MLCLPLWCIAGLSWPPGGVVIGSVNATDRDLPPTTLLYSMVSGGGSGGLRSIFHLDPIQGRISLLTRPDYEDSHTHTLIIRVEDGDLIRPRSSTATVSVQWVTLAPSSRTVDLNIKLTNTHPKIENILDSLKNSLLLYCVFLSPFSGHHQYHRGYWWASCVWTQ